MEKKIQVIFESGNIQDVSEYIEGTAIYMPNGKGVIIHDDKNVIKLILAAVGITDFTELENF